MVRFRPDKTCPFCNGKIRFIHNPPKDNFVGDTGGQYENHDCEPPEEIIDEFKKLVKRQ